MTDLEQQLAAAAGRPQLFGGGAPDPASMSENLLAINAELDAPQEPWLARVLRRIGVADLTIPLITATPTLRRSWFSAVAIAVLFALSVASNNAGAGVDRIVVFLTMAPLVPLLGVALAFGKGVDPTHDLVVAAPRDTFMVFLIRSVTVLVTSSLILLASSILLPDGGAFRVAWLLPAMAVSALTLALSSRFEARRSATAVAVAWMLLVVVIANATSPAAMFGSVTQVVSVLVAAASVWFMFATRAHFGRNQVGT